GRRLRGPANGMGRTQLHRPRGESPGRSAVLMADNTINYGFPFPEGGDQVAVHSDLANLAKSVDAAGRRIDWNKNDRSLAVSTDLDALPSGTYSIWSAAVSDALAMPEVAQWSIDVKRWG